jgi:hypothetical protein
MIKFFVMGCITKTEKATHCFFRKMLRYADTLNAVGSPPRIAVAVKALPIQPIMTVQAEAPADDNINPVSKKIQPMRTAKQISAERPQCPNCNRKIGAGHPEYIEAGLNMCVGPGRCAKLEDAVKFICELRGWTLSNIEHAGESASRVNFLCDKKPEPHKASLLWSNMKKGSGCKDCYHESMVKPKRNTDGVLKRPQCPCRGYNGTSLPQVCPHYNHSMCPIGGADEWDQELNDQHNNGLKATDLAPQSSKTGIYRCKNDWCHMPYPQKPAQRCRGDRCPYCAGQKVCYWNNLAVNWPEIAIDWHPGNPLTADNVMPGSHTPYVWICDKHKIKKDDEPFVYTATPNAKTNKGGGTGCPQCNRSGYLQEHGGHEQFLKEIMEIHGMRYVYEDEYKGARTPIRILCNSPTKGTNPVVPHGYFMMSPNMHKCGQGCPKCNINKQSKLIDAIQDCLNKLEFTLGVDCFDEHKLKGMRYYQQLYVDRYVPNYNQVIEGDGEYHFRVPDQRGGKEVLAEKHNRDITKDIYCIMNRISIFRIPYTLTPTVDMLRNIMNLSKSGYVVYATYHHYYERVKLMVDLSHVHYMRIPCPCCKED